MSLEELVDNPLWPILVETVHAMIMYPHHKGYINPHHKGYIRDVFLHEQTDVSERELAAKMGIPHGEALIILYELRKQKSKGLPEGENSSQT